MSKVDDNIVYILAQKIRMQRDKCGNYLEIMGYNRISPKSIW